MNFYYEHSNTFSAIHLKYIMYNKILLIRKKRVSYFDSWIWRAFKYVGVFQKCDCPLTSIFFVIENSFQ